MISSFLHAGENPFETLLPFKEATIHYSITGNKKGTQTTYIKEFGKQRVIYKNSNSKIMHAKKANDSLIMIDQEWTYHINLNTKEAIKEPSLNKLLIERFNKLTKKDQNFIREKKGKKILGLDCQEESIAGVTRYVSKKGHLLLRSETGIMGYKVKTLASSIDVNDVNSSLFILPKDLKIRERKADVAKVNEIINALLREDKGREKITNIDYQGIIQEGIKALDF